MKVRTLLIVFSLVFLFTAILETPSINSIRKVTAGDSSLGEDEATTMQSPLQSTTIALPDVIDPDLVPGSSFSTEVTIDDVTDMWGYTVYIGYNTSILTATGYATYDPFTTSWPSEIDDASGCVTVSYSMALGETDGFNTSDPAPICNIDWEVDAIGTSALAFHTLYTSISDPDGGDIAIGVFDNGYFSNLPVYNINTGLAYATIQQAINATQTLDGHTVYVRHGTYYEHVTITKSLTLVGEDPVTTIIDGGGNGNVIYSFGDFVNITGFTIQNSGLTYSGIHMYTCENSTVTGNTIRDNSFGVSLVSVCVCTLYHNNFINNTDHAIIFNSVCTWDNGYPSGGNGWSGYTGSDLYFGVHQNQSGSDGIGDIPYVIDISSQDQYPLIGTWGTHTPTGGNVSVMPAEGVRVIYEYVASEGDTTSEETDEGPALEGLIPPYRTITTTASITGILSIGITYNDTGLTLEEEQALSLMQWIPAVGDANEDGVVNILDAGSVSAHWYPGPPVGPLGYHPKADFNNDGKVNILDAAVINAHWFEISIWIEITVRVDPESNVIYGEAEHLSIFGVK